MPNEEPSRDRLAKESIPPRESVKDQLARLQWIVWEAIGLSMVMDAAHRYTLSEIVAAHLYAGGAEVRVLAGPTGLLPDIPIRPPLAHHRRITDVTSGQHTVIVEAKEA